MRKQQRYTPEFKAEAVKLVLELGTRDSAIIAAMLPVMKGTPMVSGLHITQFVIFA